MIIVRVSEIIGISVIMSTICDSVVIVVATAVARTRRRLMYGDDICVGMWLLILWGR